MFCKYALNASLIICIKTWFGKHALYTYFRDGQKKSGRAKSNSVCTSDREPTRNNNLCSLLSK